MKQPYEGAVRAPVADRHVALAVLFLAFFVRLVHLLHVVPTPIVAYQWIFPDSDMQVFDQWARRIAAGDVLGRETYHPLAQWQLGAAPAEEWARWYDDAPVFYKAPFYAYLSAGLYRAFGDDTILPLLLLQMLASSLGALLLMKITGQLFGSTAGLLAGLIHALYGPDVHYDVIMLRGPWITLVGLMGTWQLMALRLAPTRSRALIGGLLLGLALLVNEGFLPAPLLALVLLVSWLAPLRRALAYAATLLLGIALSVSPLVVRNLLVGVPPLKLAVTGSTVYAVFNSAASNPFFFYANAAAFVPTMRAGDGRFLPTALACLSTFHGPLEVAAFYLKKASGLLIPFENPDNASFYYAALKDPLLGILPGYAVLLPLAAVGLTLARRRWRELTPLAPFSLSLLASILLAVPLSRYRATLAVYLVPFAGLALARAGEWIRGRRPWPLLAAGCGVALLSGAGAIWQSRVVFAGQPAGIFLYRPPEFFLGADFYARQGRYGNAIAELLQLARLNRDRSIRSSTLLRIAGLELTSGNPAAAREAVQAAVETNPEEPALLLAAGDFQRFSLHEEEQARGLYGRALAHEPTPPLEQALRERLASAPGTATLE